MRLAALNLSESEYLLLGRTMTACMQSRPLLALNLSVSESHRSIRSSLLQPMRKKKMMEDIESWPKLKAGIQENARACFYVCIICMCARMCM